MQVEAQDTSVIAQLGWPDMRLPLLYSLSWPHRVRMSYDQLDLAKLCALSFSCFSQMVHVIRLLFLSTTKCEMFERLFDSPPLPNFMTAFFGTHAVYSRVLLCCVAADIFVLMRPSSMMIVRNICH